MSGRSRAASVAAAALALLPLGCTPGSAPAGPTPTDPLRGLDDYARRALEEWGISGMSIAVVKDDSVVFAEGYGVREVGKPGAVDEHTLFAIGSNTKLFTAVAVGTLVDEGKMDWDDPATQHLPGFQLYDPYVTRELTIRDLMSHRSGLGRRGDALWYAMPYDRAELLRRVRYLEPNASFRSEFGYQNLMFVAAGEASARAAGSTWDELVQRRLLQPLGMRRSNTSVDDLRADDNVAMPHLNSGGTLTPIPYRDIDNAGPAGSINSSAWEMAQWMRMLLNDGEYEGRRIVSEEALGEILQPHTVMPFTRDSLNPTTHFSAYGLGPGLADYGGRKIVRHTGGIDGMLSLVALVPEEDLGVVILTSTAGHNAVYTALMHRVLDAYLGLPARDWSTILLRRTEDQERRATESRLRREAERVRDTRPSLPLERYAGRYEDEMYREATVAFEGGKLVLRRGPAFEGELEHWHFNTFRARWKDPAMGPSFITFHLDARARVGEMEVEGVTTFERAPDEAAGAERP